MIRAVDPELADIRDEEELAYPRKGALEERKRRGMPVQERPKKP
jgi:hypothetical protein